MFLGNVFNGAGLVVDLFRGPTPPFRPGCSGMPIYEEFVRFAFLVPHFANHCKKGNSLFALCAVARICEQIPYDFQFIHDDSHKNCPFALPGMTMCGLTPDRLATTRASSGHPGACVILPGLFTSSHAFLYIPTIEHLGKVVIYFFISSSPMDRF